MPQTKINNEAPVRDNVCECEHSGHAHTVVWAAIMFLMVAGSASFTYLFFQQRSAAIPESTSVTTSQVPVSDTDASKNSAVPKQYEFPKAYVEWDEVTFEYPTSWYVVSQSYLRSVDYKYSYVLTFNPTLINISDYPDPQPQYLRVSRLKNDSRTPDRVINDMRELYANIKDEKVEIEPGITLYKMSGEKKRERSQPIQSNDYFIVITAGDGLDQFGNTSAAIYYAEPKRIDQLEPDERYDAIIDEVEEILRSVKRYQYVAPNQEIVNELNPPQEPIEEYVCSDTDGGTDIYTKGTLEGPKLITGAKPTDACLDYADTPTLLEYSCVNERGYTSSSEPCEFGCADGACLRAP
jgi:hypothetical protein